MSGKERLRSKANPIDQLRAPAFPFLPIEDVATDLPIEQNQFPVHRQGSANLCSPNPVLQFGKKLRVAVGHEWFLHGR